MYGLPGTQTVPAETADVPPKSPDFSSTATLSPASAATAAAMSPPAPEPTTITSWVSGSSGPQAFIRSPSSSKVFFLNGPLLRLVGQLSSPSGFRFSQGSAAGARSPAQGRRASRRRPRSGPG